MTDLGKRSGHLNSLQVASGHSRGKSLHPENTDEDPLFWPPVLWKPQACLKRLAGSLTEAGKGIKDMMWSLKMKGKARNGDTHQLIPALWRQRQEDKASLVYIVNSKRARITWWDLASKNKQINQTAICIKSCFSFRVHYRGQVWNWLGHKPKNNFHLFIYFWWQCLTMQHWQAWDLLWSKVNLSISKPAGSIPTWFLPELLA